MLRGLAEDRVVDVWQRALARGASLHTTHGQPVSVVYPGRRGGGPGPDLTGAIITVDGCTSAGDIEFHVHTRDWQAHGHHLDPAYNNVVLHVVMNADGTPTRLQSGGTPPLIELSPSVGAVREVSAACPSRHRHAKDMGRFLERAGEARFWQKSQEFRAEMETDPPSRCLYRGIMGALGYSRNKSGFRLLADLAPLEMLPARGGALQLEAVLLGTAGFLPSQRQLDPAGHEELERFWQASGTQPLVPRENWDLTCIRPANHPVRRLAGMARLLARCSQNGLLPALVNHLLAASPDGLQELEDRLLVPADGYWTDHFDFGRAGRRLDPRLIGRSRAREILINVLLPFAACTTRLSEGCLALFRACPPSDENALEKHMRAQLGIEGDTVSSACRQQGLLQLYKEFCTRGRCDECQIIMPNIEIRNSIQLSSR